MSLRRAPFAKKIEAAIRGGDLGSPLRIDICWGELPAHGASLFDGVLATAGAASLDLLEYWLGPLTLETVRHDGLGGPDSEAEILFSAANAYGRVEVSRLRQLDNLIVISDGRRRIALDFALPRCSPPASPALLSDAAAERLLHPWELDDARHFAGLQSRRVLVNGATGFIGARLVERLAEEGAIVTAAARDLRRAARIARCGVALVAAGGDLAALVAGQECVINLAYDLSAPAEANAAAAERLAQAALAAGVSRFVHASSIAVYDGWPGEDLTEESPSDGPGHEYKVWKRATETALARLAEGSEIGLALLQFTNVYGPFSRLWTDEFAERLQAGTVAVPDESLCNGVYVDDVVDALLAACLDGAASGRFIVTGPAPFRWRDLLDGYAAACGGTVISEPLPKLSAAPAPKKSGLHALIGDPLRIAQSPLVKPVVDQLRKRIGEERLLILRRRAMRLRARGKPTLYRPAAASPKLFAARATAHGDRAARELIAPRIGLERALEVTAAYLRWRYVLGAENS
jgi:nucleoside-diphosphate-sugar epimerase